MLIVLFAAGLSAQDPEPDPCKGFSTSDMAACGEIRIAAAERELERYKAVVQKQIDEIDDPQYRADAQADFDNANKLWPDYLEAECGAIVDSWGEATIRVPVHYGCLISAIEYRTYGLWQNWMRPPEHRPPLLPEPKKP